jgi:spore germination protein KA
MALLITIHRLKKKRMRFEEKAKVQESKKRSGQTLLDSSFEEIKEQVVSTFGNSADLSVIDGRIDCKETWLFYLNSMVDSKNVKEMTACLFAAKEEPERNFTLAAEFLSLCKECFGGASYQLLDTKAQITKAMVNGSIVIVVQGLEKAISINMLTDEKRSVNEPSTQTVIRGPKDGFIESLATNVSLIRRRIRNENLHFEEFIIGRDTGTAVYIGYMNGIANEQIIQEVRSRLNKINVSAIFESGNIEELIADKTLTCFPLAINTERPDTVAANIMEGKIAILVDGTPFSLLVPAVFVNFFEISEDYYQPFFLGSFIRFIRYLCFMISLLTPALYVGLITYHHELLPTPFLLTIIAQREGVPFPAVVEAMVMEITFEILREAGVRTPKAMGQMVSIVGALVIGTAAAEAGIISNIMIIVVSITAISNFVSPVYSFAAAARILRFLFIISAAVLGLYGVLLVAIFMVAHLCSLRSFGIPYLAPIAPFYFKEQEDVFFRFPFWAMKKRPGYLRTAEETKVYDDNSPSPPQTTGGNNA